MRKNIVIGSRGSKLAMTQSRYIAALIEQAAPGVVVRIEQMVTKGDRIQDKPLAEIGGKGLFTEELENALRNGDIDLAVHSLKDLPTDDSEGLTIAATPKRATPNDALVCERWSTLEELPEGTRVGTSSLRRKAQLLALRPDLRIVDLRGNVDTRLRKVREGEVDAAILACAGLERLGLEDVIAEVLDGARMLPAAGQGALGIQARADDDELLAVLQQINDPATQAEVDAERSLLAGLGGGCQVPIGALAKVSGDQVDLEACVCSLDGKKILRTEISGTIATAATIGRQAAFYLLSNGGHDIVAETGQEV